MRMITAIDLLGIDASPVDEWSHHLACPWCGEHAWASADFLQCGNPGCRNQVAAPEDLLAHRLGDYLQADSYVACKFNIKPNPSAAVRRKLQRRVLDMWLDFCMAQPSSASMHMTNRMRAAGMDVRYSGFNATVLNERQIKTLMLVAEDTGAEIPEGWIKNPPGVSLAFVVQSKPHTVDRVVVVKAKGGFDEVVWSRLSAGFSSLIGLRQDRPRLFASDVTLAMRLQSKLAAAGVYESVACLHLDQFRGSPCPRWELQQHVLTAVTRHCTPQSDSLYFGPSDVTSIQQALDQFPGLERNVKGLPMDTVLNMQPRKLAVAWASLRFGLLLSTIPDKAEQAPPLFASLFEQTGTRTGDTTALVGYFTGKNRQQMANDIALLSLTRTISRERGYTVQETANDYRITRGSDVATLANFSLRIYAGVTFLHQRTERYCQATLRCGDAVSEVIFPQNLLNDRVQNLEDELQRQLTTSGLVAKAGKMPTVVEVSKFRNLIIPHLRTQAAEAEPVRGVDMLGWGDNRRDFTFPGFVVGEDGIKDTSHILCPAVPVLKHFKAMRRVDWAESCPRIYDKSCHDFVAMLVASCVRHFRRCNSQPVAVMQSSAAMTVIDHVSAALGQHELHTLNHNNREGNRVDGVFGYPLVAAGPRGMTSALTNTSFIHLTDQGYKLPTNPTKEQAVTAGRAAQFCLLKVVEWCLETGGDEFVEAPSLAHHRSLLREGAWLIKHVCGVDSWDVSQEDATAIEELLRQIPYEEAGQRMTLVDGLHLIIDVAELKLNRDMVMREARDMGTLAAVEDDKLMAPAARLLPAIATYYGQEPDVTVTTS